MKQVVYCPPSHETVGFVFCEHTEPTLVESCRKFVLEHPNHSHSRYYIESSDCTPYWWGIELQLLKVP